MHSIHIRRYLTAASAAVAICSFAILPAGAQLAVTVTVNGAPVNFSASPIDENGRVFVPLRGVFERLGASVDYANGTINATGNGGQTITLQIGSPQATINGQSQTIDTAPFIIGDITFVPLRFISQALGATVDWDNGNRVVSIAMSGAPADQSYNAAPNTDDGYDDQYSDVAPPPIPAYQQPYVPAPNLIWQPGYWAWGAYGYYWVPGTWVQPPQTGYLWTPGYWSWNNARYAWNSGYWAAAVGFYGGVNYGSGYNGNGYSGARWQNGAVHYNTYVTRVNTTIVNNVYVNKTVYVNDSTTRVSYNGGPRGLAARPDAQQISVTHARHLAMTPVQRQHVAIASQDRRLLANVNHNQPPVTAVVRPLSTTNRPAGVVPVTAADRVVAPKPARVAAPVHVAPTPEHVTAPAHVLPAPERAAAPVHVLPAPEHATAPVHPIPAPEHVAPVPERVAAPVHVAPVPEHVAAPVHVAPAPEHVAAPVHVAPVPQRVAAPVHVAPAPEHVAAPVHVAPLPEHVAAPVHVAPQPERVAAPVHVAPQPERVAAPVHVAPAPERVAPKPAPTPRDPEPK